MTGSRALLLGLACALVIGAFLWMSRSEQGGVTEGVVRVVAASDIDWGHLNPLRGDKSPRAGTLWGDRGAPVPCGFLVKFVDGFSSPPHIHPVTYRGVVISGVVHNDDPEAKERWLPPGSFWTQPAGEVHITAAKGDKNVAYIEIEKGPYLVHPAKDAFQPPEEPIWMEPDTMAWDGAVGGAEIASLPGNPDDDRLRRSLLKLPAGFSGTLNSDGADLHVVVIQGSVEHRVPGTDGTNKLDAGSYLGSEGMTRHQVSCGSDSGALLYARTQGERSLRVTK